MELANCLVALGGDKNNQVPKFGVTPAEIAVLLAIHGDDAVSEIVATGETASRSTGEEIERLQAHYPAKNEDNRLILETVYPGGRPVLHRTLADLGLPDHLFAPVERAAPAVAPTKAKKTVKAEPKPEPLAIADPGNVDEFFDEEPETETAE